MTEYGTGPMKLKSARFRNFKLLRDVSVSFSVDPGRPLTVIRAENGSGKTSTLSALQWGLFGMEGLDDTARNVRLSATDWPDGKPCEIEVAIDLTHTAYDEVAGEFIPKTVDFRVIRSVTETPNGNAFSRGADRACLFQLTDAGAEEVRGAAVRISEMLPIEMKDVFFTDGDKAMNFISPSLTKKTKQHQVRKAIDSLLGLEVLTSALDHIRKASSRFNKQFAEAAGSAEAASVNNNLEKCITEVREHEQELEELDQQIENLATLSEEADRRLLEAVGDMGNHQELARRLKVTRDQLAQAGTTEQDLKKRHQSLLRSEELSWALLGPKLKDGVAYLAGLADKGVIPHTAIPVLKDRLDLSRCICGTDLSEGTSARKEVQALMKAQEAIDEEKKILTALYHQSSAAIEQHESHSRSEKSWSDQYEDLSRTRLSHKKLMMGLKDEIKDYEQKISGIDHNRIAMLREQRDGKLADKSRKEGERQDIEIECRRGMENVARLESEFKKIEAATKKQQEIQSRMIVAHDVATVVKNTLDKLETKYLHRVSERMNELFLHMIGADPKAAGGVFKSASITSDYAIEVLSGDNKTLNPDHELNGASKRALTLAFIWALTEVSGVIAPRVIDTPLGMMSGGVKTRVVETISDVASLAPHGFGGAAPKAMQSELQVILFLTRQEILTIEDLIDQRAGEVCTFTNTASYPVDLVNEPNVENPSITLCDCNHRESCYTCARKGDAQYELRLRETAMGGV